MNHTKKQPDQGLFEAAFVQFTRSTTFSFVDISLSLINLTYEFLTSVCLAPHLMLINIFCIYLSTYINI